MNPEDEGTAGPLHGVQVLDLSWVGVGCIATWLLAELGADVIKVEPVDGSDNLRTFPPQVDGVGLLHLVLDRHKRSLAVDLRSESGREAYREIAAGADAVIEGMRTGVADRMGIGSHALLERNPALTYVTLPGYGSGGPSSSVAGHDLNFAATAGILSMTMSDPIGPQPVLAADYFGAALAALALVSGVVQARETGLGARIESSLFDGAMFPMVIPYARALACGEDVVPERYPSTGQFACYNTYECADGRHVAVAALGTADWVALCELAGIDDDGHRLVADRQDELRGMLAALFRTRTRDEWTARLVAHGCVSPVLSIAEAARAEHFVGHRGVTKVQLPGGAHLEVPAAPIRPGRPVDVARTPRVGEGTHELLLAAGYSAERIGELAAAGSITLAD